MYIEYLPVYPSSRCNWFGVVNDKGNRNTCISQTSNVGRRSNRQKTTATVVKSVSVGCAHRVIDERAWTIPTVLIAGFCDVRSSHDKNEVCELEWLCRGTSRSEPVASPSAHTNESVCTVR